MTYKSPLLLHKGSPGKQWRSSDKWSIGYRLKSWSICCRKCSLETQGSQLLLPLLCYCGDKASLHYSFFVFLEPRLTHYFLPEKRYNASKKTLIHGKKQISENCSWNLLEILCRHALDVSILLHMMSCIIHNFTLWFWSKQSEIYELF